MRARSDVRSSHSGKQWPFCGEPSSQLMRVIGSRDGPLFSRPPPLLAIACTLGQHTATRVRANQSAMALIDIQYRTETWGTLIDACPLSQALQ